MSDEVELMKGVPEFGDGVPDDENAPKWCDTEDKPCEKTEGGAGCGNC